MVTVLQLKLCYLILKIKQILPYNTNALEKTKHRVFSYFGYIYNWCQDLSFRRKLRPCKSCYLFHINEGLGLLKLADTSLILINPSPSNVKGSYFRTRCL